jgi:hypothetical protein
MKQNKMKNIHITQNLNFPAPRYDEISQYRVYDWSSFTADVGGYMGLLLGHSILSFNDTLMLLFMNLWKRQQCSRK